MAVFHSATVAEGIEPRALHERRDPWWGNPDRSAAGPYDQPDVAEGQIKVWGRARGLRTGPPPIAPPLLYTPCLFFKQ